MKYDVCVLGLGYIGLPTASIFASQGKRVLGVDVVQGIVDIINKGDIHIVEPDLQLLVRAAVNGGNLRAATRPESASSFIIAVPTPFTVAADNRKKPDLAYVEAAARSIAPVVAEGNLVILESTSPVGTTESVRRVLAEELGRLGRPVDAGKILYAHCPERILPGQMLKEIVTNDRIAGGLTPEASQRAKELYACFCTGEIFLSDARTAELAKLTENAFRDVNIAFANELSMVCARLDIDVWELIRLANRHPRVKILQPGPGVGGHCIAVDPWFIVDAAPDVARLIATARSVNDSKPHFVLGEIEKAAAGIRDPVIACLGLAFKPNVDDLRESPSVEIVLDLAGRGIGRVLAVEPNIRALPGPFSGSGVELVGLDEALARAQVVVLLVDHRAFTAIDRTQLAGKVVVDTRGTFREQRASR